MSTECYLPETILKNALHPLESHYNQTLFIFRSTVIKRVKTDQTNSKIISIDAIQRITKTGIDCEGYDKLLHEDLSDWYSTACSARYSKRLLTFTGKIFVDGSEWGELMALSKAEYVQGIAEQFDGDSSGKGDDQCGQSIVFGFAETLLASEPVTPEPPNPYPGNRYNLIGN